MALPIPIDNRTSMTGPTFDYPKQWCWTGEKFFRASELGLFDHKKRIELINGNVYAHVDLMGTQHAAAVSMLHDELSRIAKPDFIVRAQLPAIISDDSVPSPDMCVVPLRTDFYANAHPNASEIVLVVEIADSTVAFDRSAKALLYGSHGIREYWIVNLPDRRLEVFQKNDAELGYLQVTIYKTDECVSVLDEAGFVDVKDLLPEPINI